MIDWLTQALLSASVLGMVFIVDSHLVSMRIPSFRAFILLLGIVIFVFSLIILILFPLPAGLGVWPLVVAIIASTLRASSNTILLYTLKKEEVSRVTPIVNTYPVFVAIIAVPLFGEVLNYWQWTAIVIIVIGVALVSFRRSHLNSAKWLDKTLFLLMGSSLLMGLSHVAAKYALVYVSPLNMYSINHLCMSSAFLIISMRLPVIKELKNSRNCNTSIIIVIFNEILAIIGMVLFFGAIQRGPVSLVSTIYSSHPLFIFIYALIISRFSKMLLEWQSDKITLVLRFIAIVMIIGGVAIIYLS